MSHLLIEGRHSTKAIYQRQETPGVYDGIQFAIDRDGVWRIEQY